MRSESEQGREPALARMHHLVALSQTLAKIRVRSVEIDALFAHTLGPALLSRLSPTADGRPGGALPPGDASRLALAFSARLGMQTRCGRLGSLDL